MAGKGSRQCRVSCGGGVRQGQAPLRADSSASTLVGPTILQSGIEEQKKDFLPRSSTGRCAGAGFSEPNSGSDLAFLATIACSTVTMGGQRQKVRTTGGHHATTYGLLLPRTDRGTEAQGGFLTCSCRCATGRREGARHHPTRSEPPVLAGLLQWCALPEAAFGGSTTAGNVNSTSHSNGSVGDDRVRRFDDEFDLLVEQAKCQRRLAFDPSRAAEQVLHEDPARFRINGLHLVALSGPRIPCRARSHRASVLERITKRPCEFALDVFGPSSMFVDTGRRFSSVARRASADSGAPGYPSADDRAFFFSCGHASAGGTQIQRNIVGERVLGLPEEPS